MKRFIAILFGVLCIIATNAYAQNNKNIMLNNAIGFMDVPYVANTLEVNENEE